MLGHPNEDASSPLFAGSSTVSPVVPGPASCKWDLPQALLPGCHLSCLLPAAFCAALVTPSPSACSSTEFSGESPELVQISSYSSSSVGDFEALEGLSLAQ